MSTPILHPSTSLSSSTKVQIPEAPIQELSHASPTGYARSKLIAERMIENAVANSGADATILRIGQIVPSMTSGSMLWNPDEMIPSMVRSALPTGVLPNRPGVGGSDACSWIEVDVLSQAILEIGGIGKIEVGSKERRLVYNLVHPHLFSWHSAFLPALQAAGLEFETVSWDAWLRKLKDSEQDVGKNPSRKLLGFWEAARAGGTKELGGKEVVFETKAAEARSESLRMAGSVVDGTYVGGLLEAWKEIW